MSDDIEAALHAPRLFNEKADKLESLRFTQYIITQRQIGLTVSYRDGQLSVETRWPAREAIDAFLLTYRFFVQDNEPTSLRRMAATYESLPQLAAHSASVAGMRANLNASLDQLASFLYKGRDVTRREVYEVFLWGGLAHANREKKSLYDEWATEPGIFAFLQLVFVSVVVEVLGAVLWMRRINCDSIALLEKAP
jgi:hypothetical protein